MPLSDLLGRRGITRIVHAHADHFEPEAVAKQIGASANVALWLERCRPAVPTLFVKTPVGFRRDPTVPLGMVPHRGSTDAIEAAFLRALVAAGVGIGLHIHHEAWTKNDVRPEKLSDGQRVLHDHAYKTPEQDHARLSVMVEASLAWLRETTGMPLQTWHFVHGCWAFGASDPEICQLGDEVPLLYSLGCRADFSFPAGRRHCDPPWDRPKWIRPVGGERACERPSAKPSDAYADGRMLVWSSHVHDWWLGLDTYSRDSRALTEQEGKLERYLAICPVIGGTAYIKTCSHGMHQHYWPAADDPRPTVGTFASELAAKCAAVGVPVEFLTSDQVVSELRNRPSAHPA